MNRRIISALLSLTLIFTFVIPCAFAAEENTVLYVSPDGSDSALGTIETPLKTLDGARQRVRQLKDKGIRVSEVIFRGGDYRMRTVHFTAEDSGYDSMPVVYKAYPGETPRFKGSVELPVSSFKPTTDPKILAKIKDSAKDKIIETDLTAHKVSRGDLFNPTVSATSYALNGGDGGDYNSVYVDGAECQIAQWPNGRSFASWTSNLNSYTITYSEPDPDKWADEKNWWIQAFNQSDYAMTRVTPTKLDPIQKSIAIPSSTKLNNRFSKRWKAFNLLEELDMPGEFYVDHDTMKLYMYVPHTIANSTVEFSVESYALVEIIGTSNVTFSGISFEQTRGNVIRTVDVNNVDFENCTFKNIGDKAIRQTASKKVSTGSAHWQAAFGYADGAYNCDVRGCYFENLGSSAIYTTGGNQDTLTPSGNIIEDNIICAANQRYTIDSALVFSGCGITLRRNVITKSSQHGLLIYGNDHIIEDNEFSDVLREVADAGVIYQGQHQLSRGNVIQRNLIHNVNPKDPRLISGTCGIYVDDRQQGNTIINNFVIGIENGNGYNSNQGAAMNFANNIIVGCRKGWAFHQSGSAEKDVFDMSQWGTIQDMVNDIKYPEIYYKAYPDLKRWVDTKNNPRTYTKIKENLLVDCEQTAIGTEELRYATIEDNIILEETDAFVDPENMDYRLKSDSELAKLLPGTFTEKTYDMEQNGTINDKVFTTENTPFRLLYPQNGATVSPTYLQLYWQDVGPANQYRLQIATDPEFVNTVYDDIVYFNIFDADMLEPATRYYWKVTAQNTTRDLKCEWAHVGNVYSFETSRYSPLKTEGVEYAISTAEANMEGAVESEKPGYYKGGSVNVIRDYIALTRKLLSLRTGMFSQSALDLRSDYILNYFKNKSIVNKGYVNLFDYASPEYWNGVVTKLSPEMISLEELNAVGGTKGLSHMSGSVIYCFDTEITANGFNCIGLNMDSTSFLHSGANRGYFLCVKKGVIELQKSNGTTNEILESKNVAIGDGTRHSVRFGIINTVAGNLVVAVVDGETVFDYMDITDTAPTDLSLEFGFSTSGAEGNCNKLYPPSSIPSQEEFDALERRAQMRAVKAVMEAFPDDFSETANFKDGADVIITDKGIIDVSFARPELIGDNMMVPAKVLSDAMGIDVSISGNTATLTKDGISVVFTEAVSTYNKSGIVSDANHAPYMKNGYLMVSILDIKEIFDYELTDDWLHDMAIVSKTGSFNVVNDSAISTNVVKVIEKISAYTGGKNVYFSDNEILGE